MNLNEELSLSSSDLFNFQLTGRIAASGNVQSMLNFKKECVERCFCHLLSNNEALVSAPELPATTLARACYYGMFQGCTSLTKAPELPATTVERACYYVMFQGCTSLTKAPELPATTLVESCYYGIFKDCTKLNYIKVGFTAWLVQGTHPTTDWVAGVGSTGTFYKPSALPEQFGNPYNAYIPSGWTVVNTD
jgi:hypothetical protein